MCMSVIIHKSHTAKKLHTKSKNDFFLNTIHNLCDTEVYLKTVTTGNVTYLKKLRVTRLNRGKH